MTLERDSVIFVGPLRCLATSKSPRRHDQNPVIKVRSIQQDHTSASCSSSRSPADQKASAACPSAAPDAIELGERDDWQIELLGQQLELPGELEIRAGGTDPLAEVITD